MTYKVLLGCELAQLLSEAAAQTQTGAELITKYRAHLMSNPESCALVNSFVKEAEQVRYDNGVNAVLEVVADYINSNKVSWQLATACEAINADGSARNFLQRNAAQQVSNLLEMDEENVVKYIRAGAMKNVMFCEAFRRIAKGVFSENPIVEHTAEYTKFTPVSMVEHVGDAVCFVVSGELYKIDENSSIDKGNWNEVSNTFRTVESLLESDICSVDENSIFVKYNNKTYEIKEAGIVHIDDKELTVEQFRDDSRLLLMTANPRRRNEVAGVMEAIAQVSENYDEIVTLDNTAIYSTPNDKFVVIESGSRMYAALLRSTHNAGWSINEDAVKVCEFVKQRTNAQISENYKANIEGAIEEADAESAAQMQEALEKDSILSIKERIELLTEKFKNDPTKLAVLSKLAFEVADL